MTGKLRNMASIYLRRGDELLFLYRVGSRVIDDSYTAASGGHFEPDELNDARACALREMNEELGLTEDDIANLSLRYITLRLKNGEVRHNYYFFADLISCDKPLSSNEGNLKWFSLEALEKSLPEMPFSAGFAMKHWLEIGRYNDSLYVGVSTGTDVIFTELREN